MAFPRLAFPRLHYYRRRRSRALRGGGGGGHGKQFTLCRARRKSPDGLLLPSCPPKSAPHRRGSDSAQRRGSPAVAITPCAHLSCLQGVPEPTSSLEGSAAVAGEQSQAAGVVLWCAATCISALCASCRLLAWRSLSSVLQRLFFCPLFTSLSPAGCRQRTAPAATVFTFLILRSDGGRRGGCFCTLGAVHCKRCGHGAALQGVLQAQRVAVLRDVRAGGGCHDEQGAGA